ncbi:MAG: glycosyltransferase family 2 protein [Acidobacteriota bacterium]
MSVLAWLLVLAVLPATLDAFIRLLLTIKARAWLFGSRGAVVPRRWLVLVPARAEGENVEATLRSVVTSAAGDSVSAVLLLDGPDPAAAACARRLGVEVVVKPAPGPSKAMALVWAAATLEERIRQADAVLLVDVGSRLEEGFFARFAWPAGADAVQAFLCGRGRSVGEAAARSELLAQHREDRGRERLGWAVRLRGTGTAMRPAVALAVLGRLRSAVEDFEMSLLLAAEGYRLQLGPPSPVVLDDKPETVGAAARQRSRWFAGRFSLLYLQPGAWLRLIWRSPLEGSAFLVELFSRPLTLTVPARLGAVAALAWAAGPLALAAGTVLVASAALDVIWVMAGTRRGSWGAAARLGVAWVAALLMLPRTFFGWTRVRPRR